MNGMYSKEYGVRLESELKHLLKQENDLT
ncbi:Protein of unknown function [Bacillus cytotoxicus]|uniref:Uncharacterized protein n=1 Tax=Bacillus cytotoxicus TaxID=580165 RepID=A0AAX2CI29_9BACI|nr:Protein of unknown function [Bacillus cytotoxicus]